MPAAASDSTNPSISDVRVAMCGAGGIIEAHVAAAQFNGYHLTSIASRSIERAQAQATAFHTRAVSYDQLPGDANVVIVATPPQQHASDVLRMLRAGASVLVEKPLCTTLADADDIVRVSAEHGDRLLYAENLAYAPIIGKVLALVPQLGRLTHLQIRTLQSLPASGGFTTDEWGGGALFDLGIHPLALTVLIANAGGAGRAVSVSAILRGAADGSHNSDEHAEVTLVFESGLRASVVSSWQCGPEPLWDIEVASETGVIRADLLPERSLELHGVSQQLPAAAVPLAIIEDFGYLGQLRALVQDVAASRVPAMSASFGRHMLDIVCAAYAAAGHGGSESLPFRGSRHATPLQLWRGATNA